MPKPPYRIITQGGKTKPRVVTFDRKEGLGATGLEPSFVRMMRPEHFLKLAAPTPYTRHGYVLRSLVKGRPSWTGRDGGWKFGERESDKKAIGKIGNPVLEVDWNDELGAWDVKAHEGRHRSMFLARRGNPLIPVDIIPKEKKSEITSEMRRAPFLPQRYDLYADNGRYREYLRETRQKPQVVYTKRDKRIILLPEE